MALIKCHECGTEVSSKAKACPPVARSQKKIVDSEMGAGIFVAFIAYGAYVDSNMTPEQKAARAEERAAREAEDSKQAAEKKARDDESVQQSDDGVRYVAIVCQTAPESTWLARTSPM